jgi:hypothetical protein
MCKPQLQRTREQDPRSWREAFDAIVTPLHDLPGVEEAEAWQWLPTGGRRPGRFIACVGSLHDLPALVWRQEWSTSEARRLSDASEARPLSHDTLEPCRLATAALHRSALIDWIRGGNTKERAHGETEGVMHTQRMEHAQETELVAVVLGAPTRHCRYRAPSIQAPCFMPVYVPRRRGVRNLCSRLQTQGFRYSVLLLLLPRAQQEQTE